jgi:hypothetical protein
MSIGLGHIILLSSQKEQLAALLSQIFDMEIVIAGDDIHLNYQQIKYIIKQTSKKNKNPNTVIEYLVDSREELESISQKVKFFYYRTQNSEEKIIDDLEVYNFKGQYYFELTDCDSRIWRFVCQE